MTISDEFRRLKDICYLDHVGTTLYSEKQIQDVFQDFSTSTYGNPHSLSVASRHTSDVLDQIRYRVLQFFNTDMDEYDVVFTSGTTAALKLVAESFNFGKENPGVFTHAQENHTSVIGMREEVAKRCSSVNCYPTEQLHRIFSSGPALNVSSTRCEGSESNSLFVFSGLCNFSGFKSPLGWIKKCQQGFLQKSTDRKSNWYCLLDAASMVSTSSLDLSQYQPDFVTISFYKIFGYPTGLGALLVRNSSAEVLSNKAYFGGGTVLMALSAIREHRMRPVLHERLEDGTLPFLSIIALRHGFDTLLRLTGSVDRIRQHTFHLARRTHHSLKSLTHANGAPVARLYCDTDFEDPETQGAVVNFNLLRANGEYVGYFEVLHMANSFKIQLRTGCFCNPGACQRHLGLTEQDLISHFQAGHVCGDHRDLIDGVPTGSVRVSFGYMSTEADVDHFLGMIYSCFVESTTSTVEQFESANASDVLEDKWFDAVDGNSSITLEERLENAKEAPIKSSAELTATLSEVVLFPIKSCGGFRPTRPWLIGCAGLAYDRMWMVITSAGTALTQTQEPRLACIRPVVDLENRQLHISFTDHSKKVSISLDEVDCTSNASELCQSKVCGDRIKGQDCGNEVAVWLSEALGRYGLRLVRQLNEDARRGQDGRKALALANKAQFLLVSETSVHWLGEQINPAECDKAGLADRFRANLLIRGVPEPFSEAEWKALQIGTQHFTVDGPCTRCGVVCIDQATGMRTNEPLRTLSAVLHGKIRFGVYLTHRPGGDDDGICLISSGDVVKIMTDESR